MSTTSHIEGEAILSVAGAFEINASSVKYENKYNCHLVHVAYFHVHTDIDVDIDIRIRILCDPAMGDQTHLLRRCDR